MIFTFIDRQVRVVSLNGKSWFVANDVCRALDFKVMANGNPNVTQALIPLDRDEKCLYKIKTPSGSYKFRIISRSGLNKLIMRSNKPIAKKFQDWLAREVIPAIQDGDVKSLMRVMESATGMRPEDYL